MLGNVCRCPGASSLSHSDSARLQAAMAAPRLTQMSGVWQVGDSAGMAAEVARVRDTCSVSSDPTAARFRL